MSSRALWKLQQQQELEAEKETAKKLREPLINKVNNGELLQVMKEHYLPKYFSHKSEFIF